MDFSAVTETPGDRIRPEALVEMYTRYAHAGALCGGGDVLEVACGAGQGLGLLATRVRRIIGGDCSPSLLARARAHYGSRVPLVRLDAHHLPFRDASFDAILLFEALYYLASARTFFAEARRLLRRNGLLIVCTTNRESAEFNPSPWSTAYLSAAELSRLLSAEHFDVTVYGAIPDRPETMRDRVVLLIRRVAVPLGLVPRTMKAKALLKRTFYGELVAVPSELSSVVTRIAPLVPVGNGISATGFKVLYAVARVNPADQ